MNQPSPMRIGDVPAWRSRHAIDGTVETDFATRTQSEQFHLRDYWKILLKRRWPAILACVVVLFIGSYFTLTATEVYTAVAMLRIEPQSPTITNISEIFPAVSGAAPDYYQTQFVLLRSRALAGRVITDLRLDANETFKNARVIGTNPFYRTRDGMLRYLGLLSSWASSLITAVPNSLSSLFGPFEENARQEPEENVPAPPQADSATARQQPAYNPGLVGRYLNFLEVTPVRNTRLVQIRFTTPDPALSQLLANHHVAAFLRMNLETRFELTNEARDFLDKKNAELRTKMEQAEAALNRFRQKHGVVSLEKGENFVVDRLVDINRQLTAAKAQRIDAESLYRTVQNKDYQDLSDIMRQGLVQQLRSTVVTLEAERAKSSLVFKPDHPRMKELNQQVNEARAALNAEVANMVRSVQSNYIAARAREEALQAEASRQQALALNLKEIGVEYQVLQEEVNVNRALYESVLKRLNETNVSNDLVVSNMQVAEAAEQPTGSSGPVVSLNLFFYSLLGLVLGVGLAFSAEYFDSTVSTPEDVWRVVFLNTLGVVPDLKTLKPAVERLPLKLLAALFKSSNGSAMKELVIARNPRSIVGESFHAIRTALLLSQPEKPPQMILVTSASPGEGKTMTSINLGIVLAQDGHKVVIVDADMRQGCCHSRLGLKNNRGLSNVLTGRLALQEGIQETFIPGLMLLSRGVIPPNPAALLGSRKMKETMDHLRTSFNFIIIDCTPVIALSDANLLSAISDGVMLVMHGQKTAAAAARQAMERLNGVHARMLGVVLNGVNMNHPDYAYYRYSHSYYRAETSTAEQEDDLEDVSAVSHDRFAEPLADKEPKHESESVDFSTSGPDRTILSPGGMQFLTLKLSEAMGPMASMVLGEQVFALGESLAAFPKARLNELVDLVSRDILQESRKADFKREMSQALRDWRI